MVILRNSVWKRSSGTLKITCIYEGTSEIQQNIISTFRWKKTRKSKGAYYETIATDMDKCHGDCDQAGCQTIAACARALNRTIDFAHVNRLTRHQQVMFALSEMMTYVEVGHAMGLRAASQADDITLATARVFASTCARLVAEKSRLIAWGSQGIDTAAVDDFVQSLDLTVLEGSVRGVIDDMDRIADHIFERAS